MCDTLPPAPLSVRRVRLSGLALAFALKRITIVIINVSLSASAVPQGLSGVTESDSGGNTWVNLD